MYHVPTRIFCNYIVFVKVVRREVGGGGKRERGRERASDFLLLAVTCPGTDSLSCGGVIRHHLLEEMS